jgi:LacI family transcriptional regulator
MPPISTLRQSARDLGRTGVEMLLARLSGDPPVSASAPAAVHRLPVRLIERASVAPPRHG